MRKPSKLTDRLCNALREKGVDLPLNNWEYCIQRTYAGYWQRSEGAWSWTLEEIKTHQTIVGSQYTVTELLKNGFEVGESYGLELELFPLTEGQSTVPYTDL